MISPNEYAERRQRAVSLMESPSIMILYSGVEKVSSADEGYPFEVNRNFYYLAGIDQPDSILLLLNSEGEMKEFLFISPYDERKEKWYGKRLKSEEASAISGISNVMTNISLQAKLELILGEDAYGEVNRVYLDLDREIKIADDGKIAQVEITSCGLNGGPLEGRGEYPAYIACNLFTDDNELYVKESAPRIVQ